MAASTFVPARSDAPLRRGLRWDVGPHGPAAAAAARTAPHGPGLAPVIALPSRTGARYDREHVTGHGMPVPVAMPSDPIPLRLVPTRTRPRRRALAVVAVIAALALVVASLMGAVATGSSDLAVAGHVVLQPGETLWDIAVRSAPAGVDPRRQLEDIRRVNGFGPGAHDAWTVVLIPAR